MSIAFRDGGGMLLERDSGRICALPSLRRGLLGPRTGARLLATYALHQLGLASRTAVQHAGFACYEGRTLDELRALMAELHERHMRAFVSPAMRARVEAHRRAGDRLIVITASAFFFAEPLVAELGLDELEARMFGNNYDKDNGVSVWGHMLDGAATGAIAGMGVLSIPGAIGGGLMGLANGLWADHQDSVAQDQWMKDIDKLAPGSKEARSLESSVEGNADRLLDEYLKGGGDPGKVSSEDMANQAISRSYHQQQADKMNRDGGGSWWGAIF